MLSSLVLRSVGRHVVDPGGVGDMSKISKSTEFRCSGLHPHSSHSDHSHHCVTTTSLTLDTHARLQSRLILSINSLLPADDDPIPTRERRRRSRKRGARRSRTGMRGERSMQSTIIPSWSVEWTWRADYLP